MRRLIRRLPYRPQNPRIVLTTPRKSLRQKIGMWFRRTLIILGAFSFISIILTGIGLHRAIKESSNLALPEKFVLAYKFDRSFAEAQEFSGLGLPISKPVFYDFLKTLDQAKKDIRVKGLLVRIEDGPYTLSQVQEIRKAIKSFRQSGKFAYAVSSSFGGFSNGMAEYYLGSAFDEIWLQPVGNVSINGFFAEIPFLRGMLDKIGITPEFYAREEYKSAMESFTETEITPQSSETTQAILDTFYDQFIQDISVDRDLESNKLRALIDDSPLTADKALTSGLVDQVEFADTLFDRVIEDVTGDKENDLEFIGIFDYHKALESDVQKASKYLSKTIGAGDEKAEVALMNLVGMIVPGSARSSHLSVSRGEQFIFADDIVPYIYDVAEDKDIKAIIVRLDSPGGSPTASETIRRALSYAQEVKGKKVIVSMGAVAASGGYWIASTADHIVANSTTITGSIGVVAGKVDISDLLTKIGINIDSLSVGKNADFWSVSQSYDTQGEQKINALLDDIYNDFLARVSAGREMSLDKVREVAKGRAWTGRDAKDVGLVDTLGGLTQSLDITAQILGLQDRTLLDVTVYPKPKTPLEVVVNILQGGQAYQPQPSSSMAVQELLAPVQSLYLQARFPEYFATHIEAVSIGQ